MVRRRDIVMWIVLPAMVAGAGPDSLPLHEDGFAASLSHLVADRIARPQRETFPLVASLSTEGWFNVSLTGFVNRCTIDSGHNRGWLGLGRAHDLRRLAPGAHRFYGVPFEVLDPQGGKEPNVVAFASKKIPLAQAPATLTIPVGRKTRVLYLLAASCYSTMKQNFECTARFDDASTASFFINVAGVLRGQYENIHDWHNGADVIDSPLSRWVLLPEDNTPAGILKTRVLYVLEWRIGQANRTLETVTIQSDPGQMSTLFLLGMTGHGPP